MSFLVLLYPFISSSNNQNSNLSPFYLHDNKNFNFFQLNSKKHKSTLGQKSLLFKKNMHGVDNICGDYAFFTFNSNDLIISGTGDMYNYNNTFRSPWYDYRNNITYINILENITSIGSYCFSHLSFLTSIIIPKTVNSIGVNAFEYCEKLESIIIP